MWTVWDGQWKESWASVPGLLGLNKLCVLVGGVAWMSAPLPLSPCQRAFAQCTECTTVHNVPSAIHFICVPVCPGELSVQANLVHSLWVSFRPRSLIFSCPVGFCCCFRLLAFFFFLTVGVIGSTTFLRSKDRGYSSFWFIPIRDLGTVY